MKVTRVIIKNRKYRGIKAVILICILIFAFYNFFNSANHRSTRTDIRNDISIITNRFPSLSDKVECSYTKADTFGNVGMGPSSYWLVSFVMLNEDGSKMISEQYTFEPPIFKNSFA